MYLWEHFKKQMESERGSFLVTAIVAAAVIGAGVGIYSSQAAASAQKKSTTRMLEAQRAATEKAEKKAASAASLAGEAAQEKIRKRRLAQTQTILTTPLGIQDQAVTQATTLGGG